MGDQEPTRATLASKQVVMTPHVAGVAMLMKSVNPDLSQDEALQILQDTADSDIDCADGCGAGQLNAFGAVSAASGGAVVPVGWQARAQASPASAARATAATSAATRAPPYQR
jgi:hypothetical protein